MRKSKRSRKPPAGHPPEEAPPVSGPEDAEPKIDEPVEAGREAAGEAQSDADPDAGAEPSGTGPVGAEAASEEPTPAVDEDEDERRREAPRAAAERWDGRRQPEDRRGGADRRATADRREPGDRRAGRDRRSDVDRRQVDLGPLPGMPERRLGRDRRESDRRSGRDRRDEIGWTAVSLEGVPVQPLPFEDLLVAAASEARLRARARYSAFHVGAALETVDGQIITGCNIENASYGLTVCAERVALVKALSEGHEVFTRIVVVTSARQPTALCGSCRQLLWEYCGDIQVILASPVGVTRRYQLGRLLPVPFDHRSLR